MPGLLIYSEKRETALELASKAQELASSLGLEVVGAVLGLEAGAVASELAAQAGGKVYLSEDPALEGLPTDTVADALAQLVKQTDATVVFIGSTRRGKELAPRLAQKLGAGAVTDASALDVEDGTIVASRYDFGGNTVARETVDTATKVLAVMPKTFEVGAPAGGGEVVAADLQLTPSKVTVVDKRAKEGESVNLEDALTLVGIGRGIAKREDVAMGEQLAAALNAELCATKGLADFGWIAEERIVGLSGAKTKPDLYLALGISGQIQHTVGISSSKLIAVVNKDKEAPIFQLADYGIVGDIYEVVPALIERLKSL